MACRVIRLLGMSVRVRAQACRGVGIDPRTGKSCHQLVDILWVGPFGIKVKSPHRDSIGTQIMVSFIGGLHGRVGKGKQRATQQDTNRTPFGKVFAMPQQQCRRARCHGQNHAKAGDLQWRGAPWIQPLEHTPVIADDNAHHGAQPQHESPPCGGMPYGG